MTPKTTAPSGRTESLTSSSPGAAALVDQEERRKLYVEAVRLMTEEDAAVIPLFSSVSHLLVAERVSHFPINHLDAAIYKSAGVKTMTQIESIYSKRRVQGVIGRVLGWGLLLGLVIAVALDLSDRDIPQAFWALYGVWALAAAGFAIVTGGRFRYVVGRVLEAVFVLWVVATITFAMLRSLPGGPFDQERALDPKVKAAQEARYGLNLPLAQQYWRYVTGALHGDLGESYKYVGRPVSAIIRETMPISFQLGFYSILLAFFIGIPIGVMAANKHNSFTDHFLMIASISGVALPSFIVGPVLVMIFSFGMPFTFMKGLLPPALWEAPIYYILPVLTLGIRPAAIIARMTRSSMLEVLDADFVRTAPRQGRLADDAFVQTRFAQFAAAGF